MASSHHDDNEMLPATWPFRAAGTVMILATVWFCTGWGIRDLGPEERLSGHMPVFWFLIALAVLFVVGGAVYNLMLSRRRTAHQGH
ncbi:MAG TPA: hypothetical protein VNT51_12285 [Miltoncostaeaceae bacterium]|jgi:hypothetical protein|nr:hypothetical protein [Miltoncostaeaceae bacterium]